MSEDHKAQEATDDFDPLPTDESVGEVPGPFRSLPQRRTSCIPSPVVPQHRADHEESEGRNTFGRAATLSTGPAVKKRSLFGTTSFGRRFASLAGESFSASVLEQQRNTAQTGAKWIERHRSRVLESSVSCGPRVSGTASEFHIFSKCEDLKFSRESMFLLSGRGKDRRDVGERSGLSINSFRLQMFTRELDARMHKAVLFPCHDSNTLLAEFNRSAERYHLQHRIQESSRDNTQSLATSSAESKEKDVFKMLGLPPGISRYSKSRASLPSLQDSITVEGCKQSVDIDTDSLHNLAYFGTDMMKMSTIQSADFTSHKFNEKLMLDLYKKSSEVIAASPMKQGSVGQNPRMLLYLNTEQTSFLGKRIPIDNKEPSTAKTESWDMYGNIPHIDKKKPRNSYTSNPMETVGVPERSSRWVKRLKLRSVGSSALGTKSFKMDEASSSARVDKLLTRVLNYSRSISDVTLTKFLEQAQTSKTIGESSVETPAKAHSWIRRWCRSSQNAGCSRSTSDANTLCPRTKVQVVCKRESRKSNWEGKQLPSIAAMALVGKAVGNLTPCEFRRRGPYLVWNTDEVQL